MLVVINQTQGNDKKYVRAVVGRFAWRVHRDIWIWPKHAIRDDICRALEGLACEDKQVLFVWKDSKTYLGFGHFVFPSCLNSGINRLGLWDES